MHISRMDLNLFVVFDAIYSEASITRASEQLNLSQPAVSHALGRLRNQLGDPLFRREGRRMVPTTVARNMIQPVRRALRGLEISLNDATRFNPAQAQREFVIGTRGVIESTLLHGLMARLMAQAPGLSLQAVAFERRDLDTELAAGTLDLALDVLVPVSPDLRHRRIGADQMVVVAREGHPVLAGVLDLERYLAAEHVLVSARRRGGGLEDLALSRHGLQRRIRLRCQQHFAACQVVAATDLLLTAPAQYVAEVQGVLPLLSRPFPLTAPQMEICLYWHGSLENDAANRWLRDQLIPLVAGNIGSA